MNVNPISISFKGQAPQKTRFVGNAIEKAGQKAEEKYQSPGDVYTSNSFDVHASFWGEIAKSVGKAVSAAAKAVKNGVNETIEKAGQKAEEQFKTPEDVYTKDHTDVNKEVVKGLAKTAADAAKAPFKKESDDTSKKA